MHCMILPCLLRWGGQKAGYVGKLQTSSLDPFQYSENIESLMKASAVCLWPCMCVLGTVQPLIAHAPRLVLSLLLLAVMVLAVCVCLCLCLQMHLSLCPVFLFMSVAMFVLVFVLASMCVCV